MNKNAEPTYIKDYTLKTRVYGITHYQHVYYGQREHGYVIHSKLQKCQHAESWPLLSAWMKQQLSERSKVKALKCSLLNLSEGPDTQFWVRWTRQKCHQLCYFSPRPVQCKHVCLSVRCRPVITEDLRKPQNAGLHLNGYRVTKKERVKKCNTNLCEFQSTENCSKLGFLFCTVTSPLTLIKTNFCV